MHDYTRRAVALKLLAAEVAAIDPKKERELMIGLPFAARLWALTGDSSELNRYLKCLTPSTGVLTDLIHLRAKEGVWDLSHALGEQLGFFITETQDFVLLQPFLEQSPVWSVEAKDIAPILAAWASEANAADLDSDAVAWIEEHLECFDIPAKWQLDCISSPLEGWLLEALSPDPSSKKND